MAVEHFLELTDTLRSSRISVRLAKISVSVIGCCLYREGRRARNAFIPNPPFTEMNKIADLFSRDAHVCE